LIDIIKHPEPKKKILRVKVYWDKKLILNQSKYFSRPLEGFKEIAWIFKSALVMAEGKASFEELNVKKGEFEKDERKKSNS